MNRSPVISYQAAAHDNPQDYIYDPEWYEYTSEDYNYLQLALRATVKPEDVAVAIEPAPVLTAREMAEAYAVAYYREHGVPYYIPFDDDEDDDCYSMG